MSTVFRQFQQAPAAPAAEPQAQDIRGMLHAATAKGLPLPPEAAELLDEVSPPALCRFLTSTGCRDRVLHPSQSLQRPLTKQSQHKRGGKGDRGDPFNLLDAFDRKLRGQGTQVSPLRLLYEIRRQNHGLLKELPEQVRFRLAHSLQIQLCPMAIRRRMKGKTGLLFRVGERATTRRPVELDDVEVTWLDFEPGEFLRCVLHVGQLCCDDLGGLTIVEGEKWDFNLSPLPNGRGFPVDRAVTLSDGLDLHAHLEASTISRSHELPGIHWPELLAVAGSDDVLAYVPADICQPGGPTVPEAAKALVVKAVALLRKCKFDRGAVITEVRKEAEGSGKIDPAWWILIGAPVEKTLLADGDIDKLQDSRAGSYAQIIEVLGPTAGDFVRSVIVSEIFGASSEAEADEDNDTYFPVGLACGDARAFMAGRELRVRFGKEHFGREVRGEDGSVTCDLDLPAIQAISPPRP